MRDLTAIQSSGNTVAIAATGTAALINVFSGAFGSNQQNGIFDVVADRANNRLLVLPGVYKYEVSGVVIVAAAGVIRGDVRLGATNAAAVSAMAFRQTASGNGDIETVNRTGIVTVTQDQVAAMGIDISDDLAAVGPGKPSGGFAGAAGRPRYLPIDLTILTSANGNLTFSELLFAMARFGA